MSKLKTYMNAIMIAAFMMVIFSGLILYLVQIRGNVDELLINGGKDDAIKLYHAMNEATIMEQSMRKVHQFFERDILHRKGVGNFVYYRDRADGFALLETKYDPAVIPDAVRRLMRLKQKADAVDSKLLMVGMPSRLTKPLEAELRQIDFANQFKDDLYAALPDDIELLDLRAAPDVNQMEMYFKTDHHQTNQAAFFAFQRTIDALISWFQVPVDRHLTDSSNYHIDIHENTFYGTIYENLGGEYLDAEDFAIITPEFDSDYQYQAFNADGEIVRQGEGSFRDVFINWNTLFDDNHPDKFTAILPAGFVHVSVKNKLQNNGLKLLILTNSYGRLYTPFMSQCFSETHYLNIADKDRFSGDLGDYIDDYRPNIIVYVVDTIVFRPLINGEMM